MNRYQFSILEEIDFPNEDLKEVELTGTLSYGNRGIGVYEYWGAKCNDVRYAYELEDIGWDKTMYSKEENEAIDKYTQLHFSSLEDKFIGKIDGDNDYDYE